MIGNPDRHFGSPGNAGQANLARHVAANGRKFPSPWPRRLGFLAVIAALVVAAVGLAWEVVL